VSQVLAEGSLRSDHGHHGSEQEPLVGREQERAALEFVLARLKEGRGGFVLLADEAGIGMTRLADDVL